MIYKYSDFLDKENLLTEGGKYRPSNIYYVDDVIDLIDKEWYGLEVEKHKVNFYKLNFRVKDDDDTYNYYSVLIEKKFNDDMFYMEDSTKFKEKFKHEFLKNPTEYIEKFKYEPKFLGDLSHVKDAGKYNM